VLSGILDGWNRKGLISERGRRKQAFGIMRRWYGDMPDGSGSD